MNLVRQAGREDRIRDVAFAQGLACGVLIAIAACAFLYHLLF